MRITHAIFAGIVAALASLTAPARAKNSDAKNSDAKNSEARNSDAKTTGEQPASSSCSALQQTADGTWARLPCQELGSPQQAPHKSAARNPEQQTR
jgi:hypothetical protein